MERKKNLKTALVVMVVMAAYLLVYLVGRVIAGTLRTAASLAG